MEKVYISGPITDSPFYEEKFSKIESTLSDFGYLVVNPVKVGKKLDKSSCKKCTREDYMKADIQALLECDGIFFMEGADKSEGCQCEKIIAEQCGIPTLELKLLSKKW